MSVPAIIRSIYPLRSGHFGGLGQREDNRQSVALCGLSPEHRVGQRIRVEQEGPDYWAPVEKGG